MITERPYLKIYVGIDTGEFTGRETELKEAVVSAITEYLKLESLNFGLEIEIGEGSRTKVDIIGETINPDENDYIEECIFNLIGDTQWDFLNKQ